MEEHVHPGSPDSETATRPRRRTKPWLRRAAALHEPCLLRPWPLPKVGPVGSYIDFGLEFITETPQKVSAIFAFTIK